MTPADGLTDAEYSACIACKNEIEWGAACDAIKRARGGAYPHDWFVRMNLSGLMHNLFTSWENK